MSGERRPYVGVYGLRKNNLGSWWAALLRSEGLSGLKVVQEKMLTPFPMHLEEEGGNVACQARP